VLVSDDADGFKTVADEVGVQHQVCKAHVKRNTEDLIERNLPLVAKDADSSLQAIGVPAEQAVADLKRLGKLVKSRQREQASELEAMHRRSLEATPPKEGEHQSLAYRLRLLLTSSLEPVAPLDALPQLERTQRGETRWHQQCLRTSYWLVDQRTLSHDARLPASQRTPYVSAASWLGVATSSIREERTWPP